MALPQRVSPDLSVSQTSSTSDRAKFARAGEGLTDGSDVFRDSFADVAGEDRESFELLTSWAEEISLLPNVRLFTFTGIEGKRLTLLPRIMPDNAGLITIWNEGKRPSVAVWRSVFDRLAPGSVSSVVRAIAPTRFGQGNIVKEITPQLLDTLKEAYEEAAER